MKEAYAQGLESEEDEDNVGDQIKPRDVGHNIYILAHQVMKMPQLVFVCDGGITVFPLSLSVRPSAHIRAMHCSGWCVCVFVHIHAVTSVRPLCWMLKKTSPLRADRSDILLKLAFRMWHGSSRRRCSVKPAVVAVLLKQAWLAWSRVWAEKKCDGFVVDEGSQSSGSWWLNPSTSNWSDRLWTEEAAYDIICHPPTTQRCVLSPDSSTTVHTWADLPSANPHEGLFDQRPTSGLNDSVRTLPRRVCDSPPVSQNWRSLSDERWNVFKKLKHDQSPAIQQLEKWVCVGCAVVLSVCVCVCISLQLMSVREVRPSLAGFHFCLFRVSKCQTGYFCLTNRQVSSWRGGFFWLCVCVCVCVCMYVCVLCHCLSQLNTHTHTHPPMTL